MYFQYFLPGKTKVTRDELCDLGLGYVFGLESAAPQASSLSPRQVTNGPGGQHGVIVSLSSEYCGYYQDRQTWKQEIDADYWVGMWTAKDKRPTPDTLARDNLITGQWLRLDDGHAWLLPKARQWEEIEDQLVFQRTIPSRLTRDVSGNWFAGEVKERYRELWRLATEVWQSISEGTEFTEWDNTVIECFKCNYRVSAIEIDLLGIHDDHVRIRVPHILLDVENFETLFKKKLSTLATGNSSDGLSESLPDAETVDIVPPSRT